ncbi:MAG: 2Fe-2S iron-sulfur cluster-binding protein [Polyangiales bacterium]
MPTFKLDGQEIPFEPGQSIMQAAWRHGIEIPHYCWHPGLSVAANCRMCLVEIKAERPVMMPVLKWDGQKQAFAPAVKPKLQPACQMPAVEGQEVFAKSSEALSAQHSVQEFLLLNHPVDCPICDQAGECKLQDYWLTSQGQLKRKHTEPVHKPKAVRFGPTIVYDGERCIMCTRCIRVCDELAHDHVLDMRERGNKNEIMVSPGRQLDHRYTLMTEHVCPVGALTSKDFRFKARVWFLRAKKSVCAGCATGCNSFIDYDPRDGKVYRLRPRDNPQVNKFWMCDDGMMTYRRIHEGRLTHGLIRQGAERETSPADALQAAAAALRVEGGGKLAVVLSAEHCSEDNLAAVKLAAALGSDKLFLAALPGWEGDAILRSRDNNPNRKGALQAAGREIPGLSALLPAVASGEVTAVLALGSISAEDVSTLASLRALPLVALASHAGALTKVAKVVVPVAVYAEMDGTFVNEKGMAQRFQPAVAAPEGVRPAWETLAALAKALGKDLGFSQLADLRKGLGAGAPAAEARP